LSLRDRILGPEHPDSGIAAHRLSLVLRASGRGTKALPLAERAERVLRATLGDENTWTQAAAANLSEIRSKFGIKLEE
jgi:hypothetical protein